MLVLETSMDREEQGYVNPFIVDIKNKIKKVSPKWLDTEKEIEMCEEVEGTYIQHPVEGVAGDTEANNDLLLITTKDGYEIVLKVYKDKNQAEIITIGKTDGYEIYTVKYNANSGTGTMESKKVRQNFSTTLAENGFTAPSGCSFGGWCKYQTSIDQEIPAKDILQEGETLKITENTTIYAIWTTKRITIKYDANTGSGEMLDTIQTGSTAVDLRKLEFAKRGYTFNGWNTKKDGSGTSYTDEQKGVVFNEDTTLYAQWIEKTVTISYNTNNGTGTMSNTTQTGPNAVTLRTNTFTRTGYTFNGWNTKADGSGISYTDGQEVFLQEDTILYAQWSGKQVTGITINNKTSNLTKGSALNLNITVTPSDALNKTVNITASPTGKVSISGTTITGTNTGSTTITVTSTDGSNISDSFNLTIDPILVSSISINPNSASLFAGETTTLSATVLPNNAENKNVTWTSLNTNIATVNSSTGVVTGVSEGTTTIRATAVDGSAIYGECAITVTPLTVTYQIDTSNTKTAQVNYGGNAISNAPTATKSNYTFVGWREDTTASNQVLSSKTVNSNNITLYAVFEITYTATFNGNGATSGSVNPKTAKTYYNNGNVVNGQITLPSATAFSKTEYKFQGYATIQNETNENNILEANSTYTLTANRTIYAQWKENILGSFDIEYEQQSGYTYKEVVVYTNNSGDTVQVKIEGERGHKGSSYRGTFIYIDKTQVWGPALSPNPADVSWTGEVPPGSSLKVRADLNAYFRGTVKEI